MSQPADSKANVLVVGAGPTGLVMATELARHGRPCRIIDKAPAPSDQSKALAIQPRTLELFESMGIASELTARGVKTRRISMYANGRRIVHLSLDELDSPYPFLLMLPQSETERLLGEHLESLGLTVERPVELTGFAQDQEGVTAHLRHAGGPEEEFRTLWLVGCDGPHSAVRHTLGLPFEGSPYEERFLLADVRIRWSQPDDEVHLFISDDGLLGVFPMAGDGYRLIADLPAPTGAACEHEPTLAECQALANARGPGGMVLSDPKWMTTFRIHRRMASQFREGRVFIAGDAAHLHSPAGGQGMNTGIQDAGNLAWKLALVSANAAFPSLLDSYQLERRPVGEAVLRDTDLLTRMVLASRRQPIARYLRDHLAPLLTGREIVQERLRSTLTELAVHYRHSPIVEEHRLSGGPAAGDRAPDAAALVSPSGAAMRLFEAIRDPRHALLLLSGLHPTAEECRKLQEIGQSVRDRYGRYIALRPVAAGNTPSAGLHGDDSLLLDPERSLHKKYGAQSPCLYLIRPDGYIGYRSPLTESERLFQYLARLFTPEAAPLRT